MKIYYPKIKSINNELYLEFYESLMPVDDRPYGQCNHNPAFLDPIVFKLEEWVKTKRQIIFSVECIKELNSMIEDILHKAYFPHPYSLENDLKKGIPFNDYIDRIEIVNDSTNSKVSGRIDKKIIFKPSKRTVREIAMEEFNKNMPEYEKSPMAWHIFKRAFDIASYALKEKDKKSVSDVLSNTSGSNIIHNLKQTHPASFNLRPDKIYPTQDETVGEARKRYKDPEGGYWANELSSFCFGVKLFKMIDQSGHGVPDFDSLKEGYSWADEKVNPQKPD